MSGTQPRKVKGQGQRSGTQMHPPPPPAPWLTAESSLCLWSIFIESQGKFRTVLTAVDECRLQFRHHDLHVSAVVVMPSDWSPDQILLSDLRAWRGQKVRLADFLQPL